MTVLKMLLQLTSILIIIDIATTQMQFPTGSGIGSIGMTPHNKLDSTLNKKIFKLSVSLAKQIQKEDRKDIYAFSPINIAETLSMVLLGSRGRTFDELANVLGLDSNPSFHNQSHLFHETMGKLLQTIKESSNLNLGSEMDLASAIFVQNDYPIRTIYKEISQKNYRSEAYNVNFKNGDTAKDTVNNWVKLSTKSKISKILEEKIDERTKVVIAGVLYFKAEWENPFWEHGTNRRPFYMNGDNSASTAMIDMMTNAGEFPYYYDANLDCEILGLPYKGNKSTMFIVMPKNSSKDKLKQLQSKLTPDGLERLIKNTKNENCAVAFPKMRLESSYNFVRSLKALGVRSLFIPNQANLALLSPGVTASGFNSKPDDSAIMFPHSSLNCREIFDPIRNISKCEDPPAGSKVKRIARQLNTGEQLDHLIASLPDSENPGIFVTQVLHKVYMDINEKGTEAAASIATSVRRSDVLIFRVDTPFLFYIWNHDAQIVLFWGAVNTPTPSYN